MSLSGNGGGEQTLAEVAHTVAVRYVLSSGRVAKRARFVSSGGSAGSATWDTAGVCCVACSIVCRISSRVGRRRSIRCSVFSSVASPIGDSRGAVVPSSIITSSISGQPTAAVRSTVRSHVVGGCVRSSVHGRDLG